MKNLFNASRSSPLTWLLMLTILDSMWVAKKYFKPLSYEIEKICISLRYRLETSAEGEENSFDILAL